MRWCGTEAMTVVLALALLANPAVTYDADMDDDARFDPVQAHSNMPAGWEPEPFASAETNHMQHFQDADANQWKWETTQNLQRDYMTELFNISSTLRQHPDAVQSYEDLREHLDKHCNRVYNGTCEWQFSPPFNPALAGAGVGEERPSPATGAIVYVCCADAQELQDLLWSLKFLDLNFNDEFKYKVLIFHENLGKAQRNVIEASTRSDVTLHRVLWRVPSSLSPCSQGSGSGDGV